MNEILDGNVGFGTGFRKTVSEIDGCIVIRQIFETVTATAFSCGKDYYGYDFIKPLSGLKCQLCNALLDDEEEVVSHVKTSKHLQIYKQYLESNAEYMKQRITEKKEMARILKQHVGKEVVSSEKIAGKVHAQQTVKLKYLVKDDAELIYPTNDENETKPVSYSQEDISDNNRVTFVEDRRVQITEVSFDVIEGTRYEESREGRALKQIHDDDPTITNGSHKSDVEQTRHDNQSIISPQRCDSNMNLPDKDHGNLEVHTEDEVGNVLIQQIKIEGEFYVDGDICEKEAINGERARQGPVMLKNDKEQKRAVTVAKSSSQSFEGITKPASSKYICNQCGESFNLDSHLEAHLLVHKAEELFVCENCGETFVLSESLKEHTKTHASEGNFPCEVCGKTFKWFTHLEEHVQTHRGVKQNACDICGKRFVLRRHMKAHQLIHTGKRPFNCEICGKSFLRKSGITSHNMTHTGEKPFICGLCGKKFSRLCEVKTHQLMHVGRRPYACDICGKGFLRKGALKTHQVMHAGQKPYECTICNRRFFQKGALKRHQLIHRAKVRNAPVIGQPHS